ncbi:MAG: hypothetical protein U5K30_00930 [Acidimicrobiales bacterium]|nr:hypothetical protein [Acidimicrobiales bacterium]
METRRWINHSLPQTLGNAVLLLYISAVFDALFLGPLGLLLALVKVGAGYGIANEMKLGYQVGVGVAGFVLLASLSGILPAGILSLLFDIILLVLLLHPSSREHQRIWFN